MIAKFHSAPGHSMETTLTINIPPPERIRAAKGERLREKQKEHKIQAEVVQGLAGGIKDREQEDDHPIKEEERVRKDDREREREKLERERRALAERGTTYKDKFQKMREKYDRVTSTHETHLQELDILNEKVKKLQAEHDLLLDAVFLADTALYDRYFSNGPTPIGHPGSQQHPPQPPGMSSSSHAYHSSKTAHKHATYQQHPNELPIGGPVQPFSASRFLDNPAASSSGPSPKPGHNYYHGQNVEPQEQSKVHSFYGYPSREPILPDPIHSPAHYRHSQHSTYRHYVPPSDHHGMPPPPPPIDSERERQREKEWERDRARREWEWERDRDREGRHAYQELPPTPPLLPAIGSNGYNPMAQNGHGYVPGPEYVHSGRSVPRPSSVARTHTRHGSRASRSNPSRSASRRRNESMKMEMDVDADMPLHLPDVDRNLGPILLDVDHEGARKREGGSHSWSAEQDHVRMESRMSGGRRSRSSGRRKPAMAHTRTPPMAMLEPEYPQPGHDIRQSLHRERERDGYGYDRGEPAPQFGHATTHHASYEDGSAHPSSFLHSWRTEDSDSDDYEQRRRPDYEYEQVRRHHRDGVWDVAGGRIENSGGGVHRGIEGAREEEEESDPGERKEVMDVDKQN